MLKHVGVQSFLLAVVVTLIVALSPQNSPAGKDHYGKHHYGKHHYANDHHGNSRYGIPFKDAEFFIEYNSTAGDTGVQVFLDDDNWRQITISDPKDKMLFEVKGKTTLGRQGLTELFFESVEPELAALPIVTFLKRFPEGDYEFEGMRNDGIKLESDVAFTHVIPCGPEILPDEGTVLDPAFEVVISWEEVDQVVDPAGTDAAGETVCTDPENLGQELEIDHYQVIVENDDISLIVDLTSDDRNLTVPRELLKNNTLYLFEVLAKEESGNQTITEGFFCMGPDLEQAGCVELFEAL
jgi:hypothetical protein